MNSSKKTRYAELYLLGLSGLYLSAHGFEQILFFLVPHSGLPLDSAYAAGEFIGRLIGKSVPLVLGLGLFIIAWRMLRSSSLRLPAANAQAPVA